MRSNYSDIRALIDMEPLWFDMHGAPRYAPFHPSLCPSIYAHQVILLEIACQHCGQRFKVEMHEHWSWERLVDPKKLHYGDPPAHSCTGDTMNCVDLAVLEVWTKSEFKWRRRRKLEGKIDE